VISEILSGKRQLNIRHIKAQTRTSCRPVIFLERPYLPGA